MTSPLTNTSAAAALQALRSISANLQKTQTTISSGLRVEKASDNAAYWSVATTMRSDNKALAAVSDSLAFGQAVVDVTYNGLQAVIDTWTQIRDVLITAMDMAPATFSVDPGVLVDGHGIKDPVYSQSDIAKLDTVVADKLQTILNVVSASTFNGVNLLEKPEDGKSINQSDYLALVSGYAQGSVLTTDVNIKNFNLFNNDHGNYSHPTILPEPEDGILDNFLIFDPQIGNASYGYAGLLLFNGDTSTVTATPLAGKDVIRMIEAWVQMHDGLIPADHYGQLRDATYNSIIQSFDEKLQLMISGMSYLGSVSKRLEIQSEFVERQQAGISKGISRLVDADMEVESSKLTAQQTQQQLAIQSLSIANSAPGNILKLFQ